MVSVSVVYHTGKGHTGVIAEAVARGAQSVEGVQVNLLQILPEQLTNGGWDDPAIMKILDASDAIIFGCPTWMGSVSSIFKAFMEATFKLWFEQRWKTRSLLASRTRLRKVATSCPRLFNLRSLLLN